jgi:hypothetical protein
MMQTYVHVLPETQKQFRKLSPYADLDRLRTVLGHDMPRYRRLSRRRTEMG